MISAESPLGGPARTTAALPWERYRGQRIALLTQHGKETLLAPLLDEAFACRVVHIDGFDTDSLGTFTRERARPGSQLDAARRKARLGMELGQCAFGLASEGAFGPDPYTGMFPWNTELVIFIDDETGTELIGIAQGAARSLHRTVKSWQEISAFAAEAGFPSHHLVLRPNDEDDPRIHKGIASRPRLKEAFAAAVAASRDGSVFAESDLRAFCNPTRQAMIRLAAANLVDKMRLLCPACQAQGFSITGAVRGVPCQYCRCPTQEVSADIWSCLRCDYREERARQGVVFADPARCDRCNP